MILEVLLALLLGLILYWLVQRYNKVRILEKIPGPPSWPLLGNALDCMGPHTELFKTFHRFSNVGGKGISRMYLGLRPYVLLSKANTVEKMLSSNSIIDKSDDYDYVHPWLGTGLLTSTGHKWRSRRKMLTPAFHFKILGDSFQVFKKQSLRFAKSLEKFSDEKEFNIFPQITLCTLDIIMESAMGIDINVQSNSECEYVNAVKGIGRLIQTRQASPWIHHDFMFRLLGYEKQQTEYLKVLHQMSISAIQARKAEYRKQKEDNEQQDHPIQEEKKRLAFLDLLLEESDESSERLTDEELREEVDTFMFEGHDTTAAAIGFSLFLLGGNMDIQERVYEELTDVLGDEDLVSMDQLRELKLLEACIKEALRLFPSVPFVGRRLNNDINIDGYDIPSGTSLLTMIFTLHRDPEQFPEPLKFDPNRFLGVNTRHPYAYVPFSAGPRNCIGQKFALMEEKVVLATVLKRFKVRSLETVENLPLVGELILHPEKGTFVSLARRT